MRESLPSIPAADEMPTPPLERDDPGGGRSVDQVGKAEPRALGRVWLLEETDSLDMKHVHT